MAVLNFRTAGMIHPTNPMQHSQQILLADVWLHRDG
jgi:hypothetical protein